MSHPDPMHDPENVLPDEPIYGNEDWQQVMDEQERQEEALQALMAVASKGLTKEAELLAHECGLSGIWKAQLKINERRM